VPLTNGINHVAMLTEDLDRFIAFYTEVFDAEVRLDVREEGLRHAFLDVGAAAVLHAFSIPGNAHATGMPHMFDRGHVDHVALDVADAETFETLRDRLVERGASDGLVTDFGSVRVIVFCDPDGFEGEIALWVDAPALAFADRIHEPYGSPVPSPA
jgi:catechol 2,3-dioxygenase-like lactoylglutathione lyase family enzyme